MKLKLKLRWINQNCIDLERIKGSITDSWENWRNLFEEIIRYPVVIAQGNPIVDLHFPSNRVHVDLHLLRRRRGKCLASCLYLSRCWERASQVFWACKTSFRGLKLPRFGLAKEEKEKEKKLRVRLRLRFRRQ